MSIVGVPENPSITSLFLDVGGVLLTNASLTLTLSPKGRGEINFDKTKMLSRRKHMAKPSFAADIRPPLQRSCAG
jgi:hypothetical protein